MEARKMMCLRHGNQVHAGTVVYLYRGVGDSVTGTNHRPPMLSLSPSSVISLALLLALSFFPSVCFVPPFLWCYDYHYHPYLWEGRNEVIHLAGVMRVSVTMTANEEGWGGIGGGGEARSGCRGR